MTYPVILSVHSIMHPRILVLVGQLVFHPGQFAEQCLAPAHIFYTGEKGVIVCGMQGEGFRWQPQRFADSETANLSLHLSLLLLSLLPAIRPLP